MDVKFPHLAGEQARVYVTFCSLILLCQNHQPRSSTSEVDRDDRLDF